MEIQILVLVIREVLKAIYEREPLLLIVVVVVQKRCTVGADLGQLLLKAERQWRGRAVHRGQPGPALARGHGFALQHLGVK